MGRAYYTAKNIYYKIRKVPILGVVAIHISPIIQKITRKIDSQKTQHIKIIEQTEVLVQGVISLQNSIKNSLQQMQTQIADYRNQIYDYRDRLEFVRLEILEQCNLDRQEKYEKKLNSKTKIITTEKYDKALADGNILLNIGCGHKTIENYLNVDVRNLPGVDIVTNATMLPFEIGTVSEIYTSHLIEHFTISELRNKVFPYWLDMLHPNGILKIIVPDMPAMIMAFVQNDMTFSNLSEVTFGMQDYDDDFHYSMFSQNTLCSILFSSGFKYVDVIDENRVNGKCREMEVWARKF